MTSDDAPDYVSRGALKLRAALDAFNIHPAGWHAADLGCSTGGFTDCLLRAGAARIFAVDTAYGTLAWSLRNDPRVVVIERANALHTPPPDEVAARRGVDLVVIDLGWTPQRLALPAARAWLRDGGRIISLIKPHYEASRRAMRGRGVLDPAEAERITAEVIDEAAALGFHAEGLIRSPVLGGGRRRGPGNAEWLALFRCEGGPPPPGTLPA